VASNHNTPHNEYSYEAAAALIREDKSQTLRLNSEHHSLKAGKSKTQSYQNQSDSKATEQHQPSLLLYGTADKQFSIVDIFSASHKTDNVFDKLYQDSRKI